MIEVRNLVKTYDDLQRGPYQALAGISFTARPGTIFGLLGPNGAGKTTALRILATLLQPTAGDVLVQGINVADRPADVRARLGYVAVSTAIYDRMTAREIVDYFGRLNAVPEPLLKERRENLFTRLQIHEFSDLPGGKMSTGMKQKVSIARALIHDPPVLIFDEATSGLDVLVARSLLKTIAELRALGKCIIFSTHIMREVERLCDEVAILHRGHVLTQGTLPELYARHGQTDLEEIFFQLISEHDGSAEPLAGATTG
jgi:sodium transport system ATP-binding protein